MIALAQKNPSKNRSVKLPDTQLEGSVNVDKDQNIMQEELDDVEDWNNKRGMKFNRTKGHALRD